jgi:hypothetical protein
MSVVAEALPQRRFQAAVYGPYVTAAEIETIVKRLGETVDAAFSSL